MDSERFDGIARALSRSRSRRAVVPALAAAGLLGLADAVAKKGKGKRNTKKPSLNAFGCIDVGKPCRGKNVNCCSGICQGKKPKKGKKDRSTCVAHNTGVCAVDSDSCSAGANVACSLSNPSCFCTLTTGNAGFCAAFSGGTSGHCRVCRKDIDCEAEFGAGAACLLLGGVCTPFCGVTGRTACAPPCA